MRFVLVSRNVRENGVITEHYKPVIEVKPHAEYTEIDARKAAADFRMTACGRTRTTIVWAARFGGGVEHVTDRQLEKLRARHPNCMSDF